MSRPQIRYLRTVNGGPEIDVTRELELQEQHAAKRKRRRRAAKLARKVARR